MTTIELKQERAKLIADARHIIDTADADNKRSLTGEESETVDKYFKAADDLESKIDTLEKREAVEAAEQRLKSAERKTRPTLAKMDEAPDFNAGFRSWLRKNKGSRITGADIDNAARCGIDLGSNEISFKNASKRASLTTSGSATGAELTWTEMFNGFVEKLKYYGPVMQLVTVRQTTSGNPLPIPIVDDSANVAEILAEESAAAQAVPATSRVTLGAFKYSSKEVVISLEELEDSSIDLEAYLSTALAVRFGRKWNSDITKGAGTTLPFGFTARASASGIVAAGTTTLATLTADNLIDLADSCDDAYRAMPGAGYMMNRVFASQIRKLKSDDGNYLWQPSLQAATPDVFNGHPVYINPDMVTTGTSAKIALFGDFSNYIWRQAGGIDFYRLDQVRILNGQISFLAFARADGTLPNTSAVKYLLSPAS